MEGCINGIGERAGNASLEEIIMALDTRKDHFGVDIGIDTTQIYPSSRMVSRISGMAVQANKAVVGENAFRHASGIHQDGVLKDRSTYEVMQPERVGVPGNSLVLGKLSGRAGLQARLEALGYSLTRDEVSRVFESFKVLADRKREVTDRDLEILMDEESRETGEPISYSLDQVQFSGGDHGIATATVRLIDPEGIPTTDAATGNGPVNAICNAIDRAIGVVNRLVDFNVQAADRGPRLAGHGHHPHREGRQDLHRPGRRHRHRGSQRQSLPQRRQPPARLRRVRQRAGAGFDARLGNGRFSSGETQGRTVVRPNHELTSGR